MSRDRYRVLVTGAAGFTGTAITRALLARGHRVVATSRKPLPSTDPALTSVVWDACRDRLPEVSWAEIDAIIHLASPTATRDESLEARSRQYAVNVDATSGPVRDISPASPWAIWS